jgi:hypothetical protein
MKMQKDHNLNWRPLCGYGIRVVLCACAGALFSLHILVAIPAGQLLSSTALAVSPVEPKLLARAQEGEEITKANWQQHPKIRAIRAGVELVKAGLSKGSFKLSKREFEYCQSYEDTAREMAVDSRGLVRWYKTQAGSDDSALSLEHYYDQAGRLCFVFISGGAANGSDLEHRIYFDAKGQRIWEVHQYIKGPGYTFPEVWPDEKLQKSDPARAFAATSRCPERKPKVRRRNP